MQEINEVIKKIKEYEKQFELLKIYALKNQDEALNKTLDSLKMNEPNILWECMHRDLNTEELRGIILSPSK